MFFNSCNSCGCHPNFEMPRFEIVSPCCFRPRGGVFLIREKGCGCNRCGCDRDRDRRNDRKDRDCDDRCDDRWDDRRGDCGCQRGNR